MNKFLEAGLRKAASAQGLRKEALFKSLKRAGKAARENLDMAKALKKRNLNMAIQDKLYGILGKPEKTGIKSGIVEGIGNIGGKLGGIPEDLSHLRKILGQGGRRAIHGVGDSIGSIKKEFPRYVRQGKDKLVDLINKVPGADKAKGGYGAVKDWIKAHPGYTGLLGGTAYGSVAGNLIGRYQGRQDAEADIKGSVLDYLNRY